MSKINQLYKNRLLHKYEANVIKLIEKKEAEERQSLLESALKVGNLNKIKTLLPNGTETPPHLIHEAAFNGKLNIVKFLINRGSSPHANAEGYINNLGSSVLISAALQAQNNVIKYLLSLRNKLRARPVDIQSALKSVASIKSIKNIGPNIGQPLYTKNKVRRSNNNVERSIKNTMTTLILAGANPTKATKGHKDSKSPIEEEKNTGYNRLIPVLLNTLHHNAINSISLEPLKNIPSQNIFFNSKGRPHNAKQLKKWITRGHIFNPFNRSPFSNNNITQIQRARNI